LSAAFPPRCQSRLPAVRPILRVQFLEGGRERPIPPPLTPNQSSPKSRILRMTRHARCLPARWGASMAAAAALALTMAPPASPSAGVKTASRVERLTITAHLRYVDARGSYLIEEGEASGPLAGLVKARMRVTADISGSFTFYPHGGSISGRGVGALHESGVYASFGGTVKVLGGTGRYSHAHGEGGLYGVYNRKTLGLTIQTTGNLSY
jgi:hypothetical protein